MCGFFFKVPVCLHLRLILLKGFIRLVSKTDYLKNGLVYSMINSINHKDQHSRLYFLEPKITLPLVEPQSCGFVCSVGTITGMLCFRLTSEKCPQELGYFCPEILNHLSSFLPRIYLGPSESDTKGIFF